MVATRRRRERARFLRANHIPKGRSIIGSRLGGGKQTRYEKQENVRRITKRLAESDAQVEKLRGEIIKHDQTEARLVREISVLTTANKQLQHEITELTVAAERLQHKGRLSDRFSEQTGAERAAVNEPLRQKVVEHAKPDSVGTGGRYEVQDQAADEVKAKQCRQCGRWKALSEFHKNSSTKDGLASQCKKCKSEMRFAHKRV
jgi:chromosome segregation ATPase